MPGDPELTERYRAAVEAGDLAALATLYHDDALLDAHVPNWRFQLAGRDDVARFTGCGLPAPGRFTSFVAEPTVDGDLLLQLEWRQHADDGPGAQSRQVHVLRLDDGRIRAQTVFCAGVWGPELQRRMATEAPLLQP